MLCHFLQVCMWSETVFPLLSPSARPSGFASSFGFCNVDMSSRIDRHHIPRRVPLLIFC